MNIFKPKHEWGKVIPTIPATQPCVRCGIVRQAGHGDIDDLPHDMNFAVLADKRPCQEAKYTQYQLDHEAEVSYKTGWVKGQDSGIHLQGDFTREFFRMIRLNPDNRMYQIPLETYDILKMQMARQPESKEV
jgi:hypothetical protein